MSVTAQETWDAVRRDLKAARRRKHWTLATLATQVGLSTASMGQRERGTSTTTTVELLRWAAALDLAVTLGPVGYTQAAPMALIALAAHLDRASADMAEILRATCGVGTDDLIAPAAAP